MPTGKNWSYFILTNVLFLLFVVVTTMISSAQDIQDNWPNYRCNPLYMPFASNVSDNFNYCIQNITKSISGDILQPITYTTSLLSSSLGSMSDDVQGVRGMFDSVRKSFSNIFQSIFAVFLNIIISLQKIFIGIKDMMGKIIGVMVVVIYTMSGAIMTMNSAWKGPTGQLVKALGKCFHGNTKIKLQNGTVQMIKDIKLDDVLQGGSIVEGIFLFENKRNREPLYAVPYGMNEDVLVTGSHYIFDDGIKSFRKVMTIKNIEISSIQTDTLYCLATSDNKITIGNNTFWDYNDDILS